MYNPTWNDSHSFTFTSSRPSQPAHQFLSMSSTPIGSPSSRNDSSSQQQQQQQLEAQQQFVPSFLFGNQQPSNRRSFATPTRHVLPSGYSSPGILKAREGSGGNKNVHWSPVLVRERSKSPDERKLQRIIAGKSATSSLWNGPPLRSLNADIVGPPEKQLRMDPAALEPLQVSSMRQQSGMGGEMELGELDGQDEDDDDEENIYWVTVFGFQPEQAEDILELFSRHGDIMAQKSPKQGNWLHIRYSSPVHARQALAKNGTLFQGQMIGVVPCKDREALEQEGGSAAQPHTPTSLHSRSIVSQQSQLNGSSSLLLEQDKSLLLNGSQLIPSTGPSSSQAGSSSQKRRAYTNTPHHNTSLPNRSRLSISSRVGMRPLNSSYLCAEGEQLDQSLNASSFQQKGGAAGADDSFIGRVWNMFTGTGGSSS